MNETWQRKARRITRRHGLPVLVLVSLVVAYHAPILLRGRTYYSDDILSQHYPSFVYASRRLQAGEFPLWNPHQFGGFPYLADSVAQLLYPPLWLLLILGSQHVMAYIILHYFLAGLISYCAAPALSISSRYARLTSSVVFMLSGFLLLQTSNLVNFCAYVWIPLAAMFAAKAARRPSILAGVKLGAVLALQVFSGGAQIALGTLYLTVCYVLARLVSSRLDGLVSWVSLPMVTGRLALGGVIGVSIASAQILPSAEFTRQSVRAAGPSYDWASSYSLAPSRLLSLLVGAVHPAPGSWAEAAEFGDGRLGYAGVCTIALVVLATLILNRQKQVQFFLVAGLGFLLLSMGRYTPLHRIAYHLLPGFQVLRTPIRYLSLYLFCVSVVAGLVLSRLSMLDRAETLVLALVAVALLTVVIGTVAIFGQDGFLPVAGLPVLMLGLLATFSVAFYGGIVPRWSVKLAVFCLVVADLFIFGWQQHLPVAAREVFDLEPLRPVGAWIQDQQADDYFRVYWPNDLHVKKADVIHEARAPLAAIWNIHGVDGYSQLKPRLYERLWHELPLKRVLQLLNTRYVVASARGTAMPPASQVFEASGVSVYKTETYLPRAYIASESRAVRLRDAFSILAEPSFDPSQIVLLDSHSSPAPPAVWPEDAEAHVEIVAYRPEMIEVSAQLPYAGVLVLNEPYFPGWRCKVGGRSVEIHRANVIMRAVILPAGTHTVVFRYAPGSVRVGAIVTLTALFVAALLWVKDNK